MGSCNRRAVARDKRPHVVRRDRNAAGRRAAPVGGLVNLNQYLDYSGSRRVITCRLAVCAQSVVVDVRSNNVSVFNILEDVAAPAFPILLKQSALLFMLDRAEGDAAQHDVTIRISSGGQDNTLPMQVDFGEKSRTRAIAIVDGIPVHAPGQLTFTLRVGDTDIADWRVSVKQVELPAPHVV
jgi:hypothetical protein